MLLIMMAMHLILRVTIALAGLTAAGAEVYLSGDAESANVEWDTPQ